MLAICSSCGSRTTRELASYPGRCARCGTDTMQKQVFPWQVECLDCGHIKTAETTPDHFRGCRCLCHQSNARATDASAGRGINQATTPRPRPYAPEKSGKFRKQQSK